MHDAGFAHPVRTAEAFSVAPGSLVADIGAGSGHYTLALAKEVGPEGEVYAIDVQADLLSRIKNEARRRGLDNVHVIHGDIERHHGAKLRSRSLDLVVLSNVLFQLEHPQQAFEEARRILKLSGRLIVIDWHAHEDGGSRVVGPSARHRYSRQRALADARDAHFEYVGAFDAGSHHYGLVFIPV